MNHPKLYRAQIKLPAAVRKMGIIPQVPLQAKHRGENSTPLSSECKRHGPSQNSHTPTHQAGEQQLFKVGSPRDSDLY
jgi:hypothetical protein